MRMKELFVAALPMLCLGAGCSSQTKVYLKVHESLNKNEYGESTSVYVRIYSLKDSAKFLQAPFEELWDSDEEVLGEDKIAMKEQLVSPPEKPSSNGGYARQEIPLDLSSGTLFIGLIGLFRDQGDEEKPTGEEKQHDCRRFAVPAGEADATYFRLKDYCIETEKR